MCDEPIFWRTVRVEDTPRRSRWTQYTFLDVTLSNTIQQWQTFARFPAAGSLPDEVADARQCCSQVLAFRKGEAAALFR